MLPQEGSHSSKRQEWLAEGMCWGREEWASQVTSRAQEDACVWNLGAGSSSGGREEGGVGRPGGERANVLTSSSTAFRLARCRCRSSTRPAMMSEGTMSRSRKNSAKR